jgi:hypothetical protein
VSKQNTVVPCPSRRVQRTFPPVTTGPIASPSACFHPDQIGALTPHQADFDFGHIGTDATPPTCVYSGQIRALTPHQADFTFSHIGTDATPPACVYSGQIGALTLHQADFIFGHIGTDATPPACVYSGQIGALTPHQADFTFGRDDKCQARPVRTQCSSCPSSHLPRRRPPRRLCPPSRG